MRKVCYYGKEIMDECWRYRWLFRGNRCGCCFLRGAPRRSRARGSRVHRVHSASVRDRSSDASWNELRHSDARVLLL